jgi:signal peptide peptidase SppA
MNFQHVRALVYGQPWAITPAKLQVIHALLAERLAGQRLSAEAIAERIGAAEPRRNAARSGAIAVLPVYGVLMQRIDMLSEMSGGTSTDRIAKDFRQLVADPNVGTIILDIDSPGGGVFGIAELADEVFKARAEKRIVAVANSMAASAAYWLAAAASEVVVTPGGQVGSIGVYMVHEDWSAAYEEAGVKPTLIKYGEHKAEGLDFEPLTDEVKADMQKEVNTYGEMFTAAVAKYRGVSVADVRKNFGQGLCFVAKEAVSLGLADRVGTLQDTIMRLSGRASAAGASASTEWELTMASVEPSGVALADAEDAVIEGEAEELPLEPSFAARNREKARLGL